MKNGTICNVARAPFWIALLLSLISFLMPCAKASAQYSFTVDTAPLTITLTGSVTNGGMQAGYTSAVSSGSRTSQGTLIGDAKWPGFGASYGLSTIFTCSGPTGQATVSSTYNATLNLKLTGPVPANGQPYGVTVILKVYCGYSAHATGPTDYTTVSSGGFGFLSTAYAISHPDVNAQYNYAPQLSENATIGADGKGSLTVYNLSSNTSATGASTASVTSHTQGQGSVQVWVTQITGPYGTANFPNPPGLP